MPSVPNTHIDSLGYNLEDWLRLSDEEQQAVINDIIDDMSEEEIEDFRSDLRSEFSEATDIYEEALDELEDGIDNITNEEAIRRGERLIVELEEMIDQCDEARNEINDFIDNYAERNIDISNGESYTVNGAGLEEGEYTIHAGGSPSSVNPFDTSGDQPLDEYLEEQGLITEDGQIAGGHTFEEVQTATNAWHAQQNADLQTITFNLDGDQRLEIISYDAENGRITFRITDADGTYRDVIVENANSVRFEFLNGITPESVSGWNEDLLKHCYWAGDDRSIHQLLNEDEYEIDASNYDYEGYDDLISDINASSTLGHTGGALSSDQTDVLEQIFNMFDDLLVNGTLEADDINEAWDEIIQLINSVSEGARDALIAQLVYICFQNMSLADFARFFGPAVTRLEDILLSGTPSARDIAIMGILERFAGAGHYGGSEFFNQAFRTETNPEGPYSGDTATDAIERYNRMATAAGQTPGPEIDIISEEIEETEAQGGRFEVTDDLYDRMLQYARTNAEVFSQSWTYTRINEYSRTESVDEMRNKLIELFDGLRAGNFTYREAAAYILEFCQGVGGTMGDNFTTMVVYCLDSYGMLDNLIDSHPVFAEEMYNLIHNGSDVPYLADTGHDGESTADWTADETLGY